MPRMYSELGLWVVRPVGLGNEMLRSTSQSCFCVLLSPMLLLSLLPSLCVDGLLTIGLCFYVLARL